MDTERAPVDHVARFGRALREAGLPVGTGRIVEFCRAAALLEPAHLYWAGRATLVSRAEELPIYDRVFRAFFGGEVAAPTRPTIAPRVRPGPVVEIQLGEADEPDSPSELALASAAEVLRTKSFARCSSAEIDRVAALVARLRLALPRRRARRWRRSRAGAPDLRRTLRRSFQTAGEPVERAWRERRRERRRLVLLLDVSGSMTAYSRALLVFAHAALHADDRWEAFCFGTRLTRLTGALAAAGPDEALHRAADEVFDWDGGTRIGESLKRFLDEYGHGNMARGAVVVICSDGLEVGDPELLEEQMARLSRLAHRVVWLNPLKENPAYEPLARGMRAALPHVDAFSSGHNLASLEELAAAL